MLAKIVFLFFICEICVAGNWQGYTSNNQHHVYQPPHCPSGDCFHNPPFFNAFPINSPPQFVDRNLHSQRIIQQSNWQGHTSNNQHHVYQPPHCPSGDCFHNPPFFNAFPMNSPPQFVDRNLHSQKIIQQGSGQGHISNNQHHLYQPPRCPSGYCSQKPPSFNAFPINSSPEFGDKAGTSQGVGRQPQLGQLKLAEDNAQSIGAIGNQPPTLTLGYTEEVCNYTFFPSPGNQFVFGGTKAEEREFPYMAAIGYNRKNGGGYDYNCGGTHIASNFIITAAHCRTANNQPAAVVRLGGARLDDPADEYQPRNIKTFTVHPEYTKKEAYNDIGIIELEISQRFYYDIACLWSRNYINYNTATLLGYGQTGYGQSSSVDLLKADLQIYSNEVCQPYYRNSGPKVPRGLEDSQICAGDFNKQKDSCPGDSGGPLLVKIPIEGKVIHFVLAIVSFGPGCSFGIPGVYIRVAHYLDWIEKIVWKRTK